MNVASYITFFLFLFSALFGHSFSDFDSFQHQVSKKVVESRIKNLLIKDQSLYSYFTIAEESLTLYDSPKESKDRKVEYCLKFGKSSKKPPKKRAIKGLKIALDPGHFGGTFARLEERFVYVPKNEIGNKKSISFNEGTLALLTALHLKKLLENEGAIVFLTRDKVGQGATELNFFSWLKENDDLYESKTLAELFRGVYNRIDLIARANKINQFAPDITLMIHYNAHHCENSKKNKSNLTEYNFNMAFIPGAFCKNELATKDDRYQFLRIMLSNHLESSISLSKEILREFEKQLEVETVGEKVSAAYVNRACMQAEKGVFARNLSLTRRVNSTLCYGESLVQNNFDECKKLSNVDCTIAAIPCSSRVKKVAEAYFLGIKAYLEK